MYTELCFRMSYVIVISKILWKTYELSCIQILLKKSINLYKVQISIVKTFKNTFQLVINYTNIFSGVCIVIQSY